MVWLLQVQSIWKTAYKLTKLFAHPDYRGPMRAAAKIKGRLEKFKIDMPLINTLCNPGIKDRHWEMMSEKVKGTLALILIVHDVIICNALTDWISIETDQRDATTGSSDSGS